MNIIVLEKISMLETQRNEIQSLGQVQWFDSSTPSESRQRIAGADVVVVDWIDPSPFLLEMKRPSLVALMSTGYAWITGLTEAGRLGILVANIPDYATEAVSEHVFALALGAARQLGLADYELRTKCKDRGSIEGVELLGKRLGIIGLGRIGARVAQIGQCLGMEVVAASHNSHASTSVPTIGLDELLRSSDFIAVTCSLNDSSRNLLNKSKLSLLKPNCIVVATTWGVIDIDTLVDLVQKGRIRGAGLDVAIEGTEISLPESLIATRKILISPHVGFNTQEAKQRQVNKLIANIRAFKESKPANIVNGASH